MYQFVSHVEEDVHGCDAVGTILPLTVDHDTRFLLQPGQVVVMSSIKQGVTGCSHRGLGGDINFQLVAIVTNADFKLDRFVHGMDHGGREKGSVQFVTVSTKKWLEQEKRRFISFALNQKGRSLGTSLVQDMIHYHNFDVCFYIIIGEHC